MFLQSPYYCYILYIRKVFTFLALSITNLGLDWTVHWFSIQSHIDVVVVAHVSLMLRLRIISFFSGRFREYFHVMTVAALSSGRSLACFHSRSNSTRRYIYSLHHIIINFNFPLFHILYLYLSTIIQSSNLNFQFVLLIRVLKCSLISFHGSFNCQMYYRWLWRCWGEVVNSCSSLPRRSWLCVASASWLGIGVVVIFSD